MNYIWLTKKEQKAALSLVLFHLAVVVGTSLIHLPVPEGMDKTRLGLQENLAYQGCMLLIIGFGLRDYLAKMWKDRKRYSRKEVRGMVLRIIGYMFLVSTIVGILSEIFLHSTTDALNQTMLDTYMKEYPLMMFILTIVGACAEEVIYRGILFQFFYRFGEKTAVFVTSFLFGLLHIVTTITAGAYTGMLELIFMMAPYFLLGMVLALAYSQHKNLWINILTHGLWNAGVFLISVLL